MGNSARFLAFSEPKICKLSLNMTKIRVLRTIPRPCL
jgi:hypothetical protein